MKIGILCQEEVAFLGPFLQEVMEQHPERVAAVFLCGHRSAGEKRNTLGGRLRSLVLLWRIMEPAGFFWALRRRWSLAILGERSPYSVAGTALRLGIELHRVGNPNDAAFHDLLRNTGIDAVLNQSEKLLKSEVLGIPPAGFLNRHASLLPRFRGRMAGWWGHAAEPPSYGLTIHYVDEGVDTGGIILQQEFPDIDPTWPYPRVMRRIMRDAPALFWEAVARIESTGFNPLTNEPIDEANRFPSADAVRQYRSVLAMRRRRGRQDSP